jgi:hypothetical protein
MKKAGRVVGTGRLHDGRRWEWVAIVFLLGIGCGRADIGETCDRSGDEDECVDEAICTKEVDGRTTCRKRCTDDSQCPTTEKCNGVSETNIKSCQPK